MITIKLDPIGEEVVPVFKRDNSASIPYFLQALPEL
jgi:hypothetical protein